MQVQIRCRTRVSLYRLIPAFPMRIASFRGQHTLTRRGFARKLHEGHTISIPAFESIDLQLTGGLFCPGACYLELDDAAIDVRDPRSVVKVVGGTASRVQYLRELISGTVFHHPQEAWNARLMADALDTTPDRIRTALFKQGAAFTQICRTQRLMRALFESMQCSLSVADLKARVGWADGRDLEASFYDWFGVSLQTVSRLREDSF
ncbi:hypothetical protein [Cupriavidus sp. IDO]|uniref:hypothetical protein n=1 Tax=Cupriavidus sp. IDO TaxID=1539142 RepID=UPI00068B0D1E|nr:hypothetical protein [Cupriavidus sp. IDO]KWR88221.1 hypothetical protein RM96_20980 [Cupriavidus sp. IDO]